MRYIGNTFEALVKLGLDRIFLVSNIVHKPLQNYYRLISDYSSDIIPLMSEKFGGGSTYGSREHRDFRESQSDPLVEVRSLLRKLDIAMAKYHEGLGDLSPSQKASLQAQIAQLVQQLGLIDMRQLPELVASFHNRLAERRQNPKAPQYPTEEEFEQRLYEVLSEEKGPKYSYPSPRNMAEAIDIVDFGYYKWRKVEGRGRSTPLEYLYNLGRMMSDELLYRDRFEEREDNILVSDNWHIENGRHRALALKVLGRDYVLEHGLNRWVKVKRES